jgi:hypothetical protein
VAGPITSAVCPAKSTNCRSPARWTCRMIGDRFASQVEYSSHQRLYC